MMLCRGYLIISLSFSFTKRKWCYQVFSWDAMKKSFQNSFKEHSNNKERVKIHFPSVVVSGENMKRFHVDTWIFQNFYASISLETSSSKNKNSLLRRHLLSLINYWSFSTLAQWHFSASGIFHLLFIGVDVVRSLSLLMSIKLRTTNWYLIISRGNRTRTRRSPRIVDGGEVEWKITDEHGIKITVFDRKLERKITQFHAEKAIRRDGKDFLRLESWISINWFTTKKSSRGKKSLRALFCSWLPPSLTSLGSFPHFSRASAAFNLIRQHQFSTA